MKVEAAFSVHFIQSDESKYNLTVSYPEPHMIQEVVDVLLNSSERNRYAHLKTAALNYT